MLKNSKQRQAVFEYLKDRKDHPTAEQIYEAVRQNFPNISLGTVYRNLSVLEEQNLIQKISLENGIGYRYDPNPVPHSHFSCTRCGAVMDVPPKGLSEKIREMEDELRVKIFGEKTVYYGLCPECAKNFQA